MKLESYKEEENNNKIHNNIYNNNASISNPKNDIKLQSNHIEKNEDKAIQNNLNNNIETETSLNIIKITQLQSLIRGYLCRRAIKHLLTHRYVRVWCPDNGRGKNYLSIIFSHLFILSFSPIIF